MTDGESQTDEICALESIFTEEEFKSNCKDGVNGGQFNAFVNIPDGFIVLIKDSREDTNEEELRISLKFLPPIEIAFTFPPDYPSHSPPLFTISCPWLSRELLLKLCDELDRLWDENKGSEVLFIWTQFLKEESLSFLGITDVLELSLSKFEKEIKHEKHDAKVLKDKESTCVAEKIISGDNLSEASLPANCDNIGLVNDVINSNISSTSSSKSKSTQEKFSATSGEFSSYNKKWTSYNNVQRHCDYGAGRNVNSESRRIPQTRCVSNNESSFDNQRRNSDRPGSESYEGPRRYERRKPRYVDGRNEHKSNNRGYDSSKHYNRHKSPVERKISDICSFRRVENSSNGSTSRKPKSLSDGNKTCESVNVENVSHEFSPIKTETPDRKNTEENNLEGKRLFEKNRKYQKHYNDGNSSKEINYNDRRPRNTYRGDENYGSRTYYSNRYQARGGKNRDSRRGQSSGNVNKNNTKIETLVENLNVSEKDDSVEIVNKELNVKEAVCESKVETVDKLTEECSVEKKVKERIGRSQNRHKHLHLFLESYNKDRIKIQFMRNTYTCNVCFLVKLGLECTQFLPCEHVFCRECVKGYFEVRIKDGAVHNITCLEHKCNSEASPSQVRDMVSSELFARYDSILLSTTLDTMNDIIYCPRTSCQYPTSKEEGSKMARCPSCNYAFCIYCKMVYHGVEPCRFKNAEKKLVFDEYQKADPEMKLLMEQKYGKKQLMALLQTTLSETWIIDNSKKCPHCHAAIEKSDGCNKMVCGKCSTFFCWLCEARLDPVTPYKHYYNVNSRCYNLLFEGIQNEDSDDDEFDNFDNL